MHLLHIVADDILNNPMDVRKLALSCDFPERHPREVYPGRNAAQQLNLQGIENVIADLVHEKIRPAANSSHARPRLAMAGDVGRDMSVHMDTCHWSAMIYLSLDEHCQGGTHFFRHKETGWETAPVWPGMAEEEGFQTPDAALKHLMASSNDSNAWEETMMIPMRFNRLALFRGYLWHDAGVSFGDTPETGRLIIPLFFETVM